MRGSALTSSANFTTQIYGKRRHAPPIGGGQWGIRGTKPYRTRLRLGRKWRCRTADRIDPGVNVWTTSLSWGEMHSAVGSWKILRRLL